MTWIASGVKGFDPEKPSADVVAKKDREIRIPVLVETADTGGRGLFPRPEETTAPAFSTPFSTWGFLAYTKLYIN